MSANPNGPVTDSSIEASGGNVWYRLHSEREEICEALLREPRVSDDDSKLENGPRSAFWHHELLQARLRKLDDALDRLMSGSYGNCSKCGKWIEDTKLDFDPAIAFCLNCWDRMQTQH